MIGIQDIFSIIFVSAGIIAMFIGSMGVVRLPDFYTRSHAVSMSDSLGILFVITGLIIHEGLTINSLKLFFIVLFVMLSNPIGIHALARAGYRRGVWPLFNPAGSSGGGNKPGSVITSDSIGNPADDSHVTRPGGSVGTGDRAGRDDGNTAGGNGGMQDDGAAGEDPGKKPDGGPQS